MAEHNHSRIPVSFWGWPASHIVSPKGDTCVLANLANECASCSFAFANVRLLRMSTVEAMAPYLKEVADRVSEVPCCKAQRLCRESNMLKHSCNTLAQVSRLTRDDVCLCKPEARSFILTSCSTLLLACEILSASRGDEGLSPNFRADL